MWFKSILGPTNLKYCQSIYELYSIQALTYFSIKKFSNGVTHDDTREIRNIGIMAHIDAGKTTTTERFLYYSGMTKTLGEVHDGDTITDYMDQERERGITITSAAVTFPWKNYTINLIDTPGHVDFTMEVERSLRALDGAVAVFDASAGVEAQSFTVWLQADRYHVPRICYLNKMDKSSASLNLCLKGIQEKLFSKTLLLHLPLGEGGFFRGFVDLLKMKKMEWTNEKHLDYMVSSLNQNADLNFYDKCLTMRDSLVEQIAELDDNIAEMVLKNSSYDISCNDLEHAIRRITLSRLAVPVFLGSSFKNTGVQSLMDGIISYLPSPKDRDHPGVELYSPQLCALVFKIIHDRQKGALTFFRIYSGTLKSGQSVYNANKSCVEKLGKIYIAFADEFKEVSSAKEGNIVVVSGIKHSSTGDMIILSKSSLNAAEAKVKQKSLDHQSFIVGVEVPEPVFMCSIEAPSLMHQKNLESALVNLAREDPSLRVSTDHDTGQIILAGMGELHLEVINDRIKNEYKVDTELGPLQVSYRETINSKVEDTLHFTRTIGKLDNDVKISFVLEPCLGYKFKHIEFLHTKENQDNLNSIWKIHLQAINRGVAAALQAGPILSFPLIDIRPRLTWLEVAKRTTETMVSAAATQCIMQMLRSIECILLEPTMKIVIALPDDYSSIILVDLSKRRANIDNIDHRNGMKIIMATCPLSELKGFSNSVRTLSSGMANISMEFAFYKQMSSEESRKAINILTGMG